MTNFDQRHQYVLTQFNAETVNIHQSILSRPVDPVTLSSAQQKLNELPLDIIPDVATLPYGSCIKFRPNQHFVGRKESLQALATALKSGEPVVTDQVETIAATGMGGIGKTQLVSEFVHRYGQYFAGGIFWLSFTNANTVPNEIAGCMSMIGLETYLNLGNLSLDDQVRLVCSAWQSPIPRLLIFDGCEDEQLFDQWRPRTGGCRVIITSLRPNWSSELGVKVLPLDCLKRRESTELLCKYREDLVADNSDLDAIADELGDLPLALHLAGSYLKRNRYSVLGVPSTYLARLRQVTPLQHSSLRTKDLTPITKHISHVQKTFALAYEQLETEDMIDRQAVELLERAIFFAPNVPIPREILQRTLGEATDDSAIELSENALERLIILGLLDRVENGALRLHRLIAEFVKILKGMTDTEAQTAVEQVMLQVANIVGTLGHPKQMFALQPHLRFLTDLAKQRNDKLAAQLCNVEGYFLMNVGSYNDAQVYLESALAISEKVLQRDREEWITILNNLGEFHYHQGNYRKAEQYAQRALEICKVTLGLEHLWVSDSLSILAKLRFNQEDFKEAERLVKRALKIRESQSEPNLLDLAFTLNNLGKIYLAQNQYEKAKPCYQKALDMRKQVLGANHPEVAYCLHELAALYRAQRDYSQAELFCNEALRIREQELGANHLDIAYSLNGIAVLYSDQGKHADAEPLYERSQNILEQYLGTQHPSVVQNLSNLVNCYQSQRKFNQAEPLLERILSSQEMMFGPEHHKVAQSIEDCALNYYLQKKYEEAERLLKWALEIYWRVEGPEQVGANRVKSGLRLIKQKTKEKY